MRASTLFSALAVAAYSSALPHPQRLDILSDLGDLAGLTSLGGLLPLGSLLPLGGLAPLSSLAPLRGLTDSLLNTVGELLKVPFSLLGPLLDPSVVLCNVDAGDCVSTCDKKCSGDAQACSTCLLSCFKQSCADGQCSSDGQDPSSNDTTPSVPTPDPTKRKNRTSTSVTQDRHFVY
ncbi:hypothetical protein F4859DRAFT_481445 [Xylaria cf. heliscus]|nr:hypothetical protein F4859DRAFT_481445 [Xylaria cf. heliscus]